MIPKRIPLPKQRKTSLRPYPKVSVYRGSINDKALRIKQGRPLPHSKHSQKTTDSISPPIIRDNDELVETRVSGEKEDDGGTQDKLEVVMKEDKLEVTLCTHNSPLNHRATVHAETD